MKRTCTLIACLIALSSFGCQTQKPPPPDRDFKPKGPVRTGDRELYSGMVQDYYLRQTNAAIIREQTLYPYHFIVNSAGLTALGRRDLYVLTEHYLQSPGKLNVRRGEETKELYDARVKMVVDAMTSAGVRMDRVKVEDGMPGGDGIATERVVLVMEKFQPPGALAEDTGGSSDSSVATDVSDTSSGSGSGTSMTKSGGY